MASGLSVWDADITSIRKKWILVRSQENKLIQTIMNTLLRIATFNCEGINISRGYMHTYLNESSCDILSRAKILSGRPKGWVGILYKKSSSNKIKHITSYNRRVCGIIINFTLDCSCDNYSNMYINQEYSECIDHLESMYNNSNCNSFIYCGDYNTSFERLNAQTECLNNCISRCNFDASWDHQVSKK